MYQIKCPVKDCERNKNPIEGYTKEHAESLLKQHMLKHDNQKDRDERRKEDAKSKKDK